MANQIYIFAMMFVLLFCFSCKKIEEQNLVCENPNIYYDQFSLNFVSPNSIEIMGIDCDICRYGLNPCNYEDCESLCDDLYYQILSQCEDEDWYNDCEDTYYLDQAWGDEDGTLVETCCPQAISARSQCLSNCGPLKEVLGHVYTIEIWITEYVTTLPPNSPPDEVFQSDKIQGIPPSIVYQVTTNLNSPSIKSICAVTTVAILYDDDSCCMYRDRICVAL